MGLDSPVQKIPITVSKQRTVLRKDAFEDTAFNPGYKMPTSKVNRKL
jgi:hypothetical protein